MRSVVELVCAVASSLSKHHRVSQGSRSRRDVDGGASSIVEASEAVGPATGVPSPASDGVVDDSSPDEHEDDAGKHAATLSHGTGGQSDGDGREHALVNGKEQVGDVGAGDRGLSEDVAEAEVGQVTNERSSGVGESQGIAPEEPLEAADCRGHNGKPDERKRRLAPRKAGVEEATGHGQFCEFRRRCREACQPRTQHPGS